MNPVEYRLPAEWEPQSALLLAWPPESSDWAPVLEAIRAEYAELVCTVLRYQGVVLLVPPDDRSALEMLGTRSGLERIELRYNDTWVRDYGPITLTHAGRRLALDFHFNGWGGRFDARLDNRVNSLLARQPLFEKLLFRQSLFELEGGAIESDGAGTLLINRHCQRTRAPHLDDAEIDFELKSWLNIDHLIEIDMPPIPGDDTDGHIDTLARFAGRDSIVFQTLRDSAATRLLTGQLKSTRDRDGRPFRLTALPAPIDLDPTVPASYANFILINKAVLVPHYGSRHDDQALQILSALFPGREAVPVNATTLVTQGGGPHCASMQIPASLK